VKVVFDRQNRISGLNFLPAGQKDLYPPPAYAKSDTFRELPVKVGSGEWILPGTLTMPKGDGPFPAAVLVHGSGPQDRDSTVGRLKPFRDLAWGLASQGIAVLRYEKRTKEYSLRIASAKVFTVQEETVDDALLAAQLLRSTKGIDPKRVCIIGHSQGAMLAPRMALADPALAGIVLLAAPSRLLEDVIFEQTKDEMARRDKLPAGEVKLLETLKSIAERFKDGKIAADTPRGELMGLAPEYWKSLLGWSATSEALKLNQPMLILQGETDVQVTMADFAGWQKAMAGHANATLKSYPRLGHMFTPSNGKGDPAEYARPAQVSADVVNDVASWIKKR
jgi:dienelactone hydrolase